MEAVSTLLRYWVSIIRDSLGTQADSPPPFLFLILSSHFLQCTPPFAFRFSFSPSSLFASSRPPICLIVIDLSVSSTLSLTPATLSEGSTAGHVFLPHPLRRVPASPPLVLKCHPRCQPTRMDGGAILPRSMPS